MKVLSRDQLKNLEAHTYKSPETSSILDPWLQPWWNWVVQRLPLWLAPNLITIIGLIINIVTSLIVILYNPTGKEEPSRWAALLCAIGIFVYQTLDAIDGKQARRTGSSTPLGELFDPGCDSLSTVFVALAVCVSVGLGKEHAWWMLFQCFTGFTLFYCAHWQTYVSGIFHFGKFDVTEAQFTVMAIHVLTFFFGSNLWQQNIPWLDCSVAFFSGFLTLALYAINGISCFRRIICRMGAGRNGSTVEGTSVLTPAIPLCLVIIPAYVIACKSQEHIFEQHPSLYIIAFGVVLAKVTNRLVVSHMTKSEMHYFDWAMLGPLLLVLNQYFDTYIGEVYVLWICLVWAVLNHFLYCYNVCNEICKFMNLELFRIKPRAAASNRTASGVSLVCSRSGRNSKN